MLKVQDIFFLIVLFFLLFKLRNKPEFFVLAGVTSLIFSIPLFSLWIFFTAQRLTWYAAGFFLLAIIFYIILHKKNKVLN